MSGGYKYVETGLKIRRDRSETCLYKLIYMISEFYIIPGIPPPIPCGGPAG
jgi:hypothetical protein